MEGTKLSIIKEKNWKKVNNSLDRKGRWIENCSGPPQTPAQQKGIDEIWSDQEKCERCVLLSLTKWTEEENKTEKKEKPKSEKPPCKFLGFAWDGGQTKSDTKITFLNHHFRKVLCIFT